MTLIYMSLAGAAMIAVTALIRHLTLERLPKRWLRFLWLLVAVRLLVPLSFEVELPTKPVQPQNLSAAEPEMYNIPQLVINGEYSYDEAARSANVRRVQNSKDKYPSPAAVLTAIYIVGAVGVFLFFLFADRRIHRKLKSASEIDDVRCNMHLVYLVQKLNVSRKVRLKSADVASPLTVGLVNPTIILPENYTELDGEALDCVLAHELIHISRYDIVCKRLLCLAACVHWFNPLVWLMLDLANRDIELACDESVLRRIEDRRDVYALCLLEAEEMRMPLVESFGGSAISERIKCIMNAKKFTAAGAAVIAILLAGTSMMFVRAVPSEPTALDTQSKVDVPGTSKPTGAVTIVWKKGDEVITDMPEDKLPEKLESDDVENAELAFLFPLAGNVSEMTISTDYGNHTNPITHKVIFHDGIDIPAELDSGIYAAAGGTVEKSEYTATKGHYIIIDHGNGLKTEYRHCSQRLVESGDTVTAGQLIAKVGSTGMATGNHLHFSVIKDGEYVDVLSYFADQSVKDK